ncbi:uncharacterized protein C8A04DRAFT_27611 [Dichotomopilus funicola]|uniref:Uncharacterized protein n=1 Tax=Dichotomopilus funicola TaxID=1934379 RepID=A0AAN6V4L0_9PEZI|nr:hypothetical protein C8A04DRAFT_27611 [Dichotomopilus funicola]
MRITIGQPDWLATTAIALVLTIPGTLASSSNTFLNFTYGFGGSFSASAAPFISYADAQLRSFEWEANSVLVQEVYLYRVDGRGDPYEVGYGKRSTGSGSALPVGSSSTVDNGLPSETPGQNGANNGGLGRRMPQRDGRGIDNRAMVTLVVNASETSGQVSFPNEDINALGSTSLLYFKANWDNGTSYSRPFAIRPPNFDPKTDPLYLDSNFTNGVPYHSEYGTPVPPNKDGTGSPTSGSGIGGENSGDGGVSGGLNPTVSANPPSNSSSPSSNGGLATGAIIGIAVACGIVGLLLIIGVAWYLLRRRRQNKATRIPGGDSTYDSIHHRGHAGEELIAEKEAAAADVDVAPHSPYSDEGTTLNGGPGPSGSGAAAAAAANGAAIEPTAAGAVLASTTAAAGAAGAGAAATGAHHLENPPRSFTPYSDRRPSAAGTGTPSVRTASLAQTAHTAGNEDGAAPPRSLSAIPGGASAPGRATPRGLTTPYAHLVEDGMTEDEIRRLEEEERQLDAAIEQAGRR